MGYYKNLEIETMQEVEKYLNKNYKLFYEDDKIIFEVFADYKDKKFSFKDLKVKRVLKTFEKIVEDLKENCKIIKNNEYLKKFFDLKYFLEILEKLEIETMQEVEKGRCII